MNETVRQVGEKQLRQDIPDFRPGDTLRVHVKVVEGQRERIQCSKASSSNGGAGESVKRSPFVKCLTVSESSEHFRFILRRLTRLK